MAVDPASIWVDTFKLLPQDPTGDLAPTNIANWVNDRVEGKLETSSQVVQFTPPPQFGWQKGIFEETLKAVCKIPSPIAAAPAIKLASAWKDAALASTFTIAPGGNMNPPPSGTNGIVGEGVAVIDPPSVALAYTYLVEQLSGALPVSDRSNSVLPKAFRQAFLMLTYTISGIDTKPPPSGPIPFSLPLTPVQ